MKTDVSYNTSDVFETLVRPHFTKILRELGSELDSYRSKVLRRRSIGLTELYNLVGDRDCRDVDVDRIRAIHVMIDREVVDAYGWEARISAVGGLKHGFHKVGRDTRYTIGPAAQREVLDSLLELNHKRYAEEAAEGLHDKKKGGRGKKKAPQQDGMFDAG